MASVLSGIPSTVHAVATGADPLAATRAAGSMLVRSTRSDPVVLGVAVPVHLALSLGWGVVLARCLPPRPAMRHAIAAGLGIAALDLGLIGRRFRSISGLPLGPQVADHLAYAAVVVAVLRLRRGEQWAGRRVGAQRGDGRAGPRVRR